MYQEWLVLVAGEFFGWLYTMFLVESQILYQRELQEVTQAKSFGSLCCGFYLVLRLMFYWTRLV